MLCLAGVDVVRLVSIDGGAGSGEDGNGGCGKAGGGLRRW